MKQFPKWNKILAAVFLLTAALCFAFYAGFQIDSWKNKRVQKELEQLYEQGSKEAEKGQPEAVPGSSGEPVEPPPSQQPDQDNPVLPEYRELYQKNPDLVGWLKVAGGKLSTPVMQRDNEYYLSHNFYGEEDKHGQVFLDERSRADLTDDNAILYGHNIPSDQSMFYLLIHYKDPEYCARYPVFQFDTLNQKGEYAIFSVFIASTLPEKGKLFDYHNRLNFASAQEEEAFLQEVKARSLVDMGIDVTPEDQLVTLSTCVYDFSGARLAIVARRLRDGEKPEDFGKAVTANPDPVMPEIWKQLYQ